MSKGGRSSAEKDFWARLAECQEAFNRWEKKWNRLKEMARDLYLENQELKSENEELKNLIQGEEKEPGRQWGLSNLEKLHRENYHVCPLNFGARREGDCLFCREFLEKAGREEEN